MSVLVLVSVVSFLVGVVAGAALREILARARGGHTVLVTALRPHLTRLAHRLTSRRVGITLVALALAANAATGFLGIATRGQVNDLVTCLERYNQLAGKARDAIRSEANDEREGRRILFRTIRDDVRRGGDPEVVDQALTDYLRKLNRLDDTVAENPYPPTDLCVRMGRDTEGGP